MSEVFWGWLVLVVFLACIYHALGLLLTALKRIEGRLGDISRELEWNREARQKGWHK